MLSTKVVTKGIRTLANLIGLAGIAIWSFAIYEAIYLPIRLWMELLPFLLLIGLIFLAVAYDLREKVCRKSIKGLLGILSVVCFIFTIETKNHIIDLNYLNINENPVALSAISILVFILPFFFYRISLKWLSSYFEIENQEIWYDTDDTVDVASGVYAGLRCVVISIKKTSPEVSLILERCDTGELIEVEQNEVKLTQTNILHNQ